MTEQIRITCPACFQNFRARQKLIGKNRRCPKCGEPFLVVPADATSEARPTTRLPRKRESNGRKSRSNHVDRHRLLLGGMALLVLSIVGALSFVGKNGGDTQSQQSQSTERAHPASRTQPVESVQAPSRRTGDLPRLNSSGSLTSERESLTTIDTPAAPPAPPRAIRETLPSSPQTARPAATALRNFESIDFDPDRATYEDIIKPFLSTHCLRCHGPSKQEGHFRVDQQLPNTFLDRSVAGRWSEVLNMLNSGAMPPDSEPQPSDQHAGEVAEWIERERLRAEQARKDRVIVLRRLNREEYNNTIRDLIGVDLDLAGEFPEDPPAGGFDNNGSALTISPLHLELYLKTARQILDRAIVDVSHKPESIHWHFELEDGAPGATTQRVQLDDDRNRNVRINCSNRPPVNGMVVHPHKHESSAVLFFTVPHPGEYFIRVRAAGRIPTEDDVRKAGVAVAIKRQEERESKITDPSERRKSREGFEKWSLPSVQKHFEEDPRYRFGPPRMRFFGRLGASRENLSEFDVTAPLDDPQIYEIKTFLQPVNSTIRISNEYHIPGHWLLGSNWQDDDFPTSSLYVDWMEIEGPVYDDWPPSSHKQILIESPNKGRDEAEYARDVLTDFMKRAYRRPLRDGEVESKVALFNRVRSQRSSFEEAIKVPLMAVLTSPNFLFLVEDDDAQRLDDYELASRLSYFLWSSMPDAELLQLAEAGALSDAETLRAQADRMLSEEKCRAFVRNFAGQWLDLREVGSNAPVSEIYLRYDEHLEVSMRGESEAFFEHVLKNDLSALDFLHSDYVTINERLARFYEIEGVKGDHFRPVPVPEGNPRGGIVAQASILTITSNGTRTSPVWRGAWVLENLLGDPPPPPPPNAGDIPPAPADREKLTVRQRLQMHREHAQCARCHEKIDPLGFALENFAASGEWRDAEHRIYMDKTMTAGPEIDAGARMPDGTRFVGVDGLRQELMNRQDQFLRCLAEQLYTYALGRELTYSDDSTIAGAVETMRTQGHTLRSLIHHIVTSEVFRTK